MNYRLKSIDHDGAVADSQVKSVHIKGTNRITVYPNPVVGHINIEVGTALQDKQATITLLSTNGTIIAQSNIKSLQKTERIRLNTVSSGLYLLKISVNNEVMVKKINVMSK